ncbi:MAG: hypothetical protein FWH36_02370 [Lentimicrobiaceae bacterium]|nr:hypothetical protein [Lentimicrobiaceae bacterium]
MEAKEAKYTSWETIQELYPDRFVLLENPVYDPEPHLKEAILRYKHKNRNKVIEKELELKPHYSTLLYTGGIRGDRAAEMVWIL